jgi:rhamnogalacturonan endolyase
MYYVCLTSNNTFDSCVATHCDSVNVVIAGIHELQQADFELQIFPNPINDFATISYTLNKDADVQIVLTDLPGKVISVVENTESNRGKHELKVDLQNIANGIYLLEIRTAERIETRKIIISR